MASGTRFGFAKTGEAGKGAPQLYWYQSVPGVSVRILQLGWARLGGRHSRPTSPLVPMRTDGPITGNSKEKVDTLSLKSVLFSRFAIPSPKPVGQAWVKRIVFSLSTCQPLIG